MPFHDHRKWLHLYEVFFPSTTPANVVTQSRKTIQPYEHEQACARKKNKLIRYCAWGRGHGKLTSWLGILLIRDAGGVPVSRIICCSWFISMTAGSRAYSRHFTNYLLLFVSYLGEKNGKRRDRKQHTGLTCTYWTQCCKEQLFRLETVHYGHSQRRQPAPAKLRSKIC